MSIIVLDLPYDVYINQSQARTLPYFTSTSTGEKKYEGTFTIPPLNTDIDFEEAPNLVLTLQQHQFLSDLPLPDVWDWKNIYPEDSQEIKEKKKYITSPPNQWGCGSCWAMAVANAISDVFTVQKGFNPRLSTTYSLSCYSKCIDITGKSCGCSGGNPHSLLQVISQNGVASQMCVDYSWCNQCQGTISELNKLIPNCGCYFPTDKHYLYMIEGITKTEDVNVIKAHIMNVGPAISGFNVFPNFEKSYGNFSSTADIYIESESYGASEGGADQSQPTGGHAIVILGWGTAKVGKYGDVPYWFCRNTWGERWGKGGYTKMAMWPINKKTCLEKTVTLVDADGVTRSTGGVLLFQLSRGFIRPHVFPKIESQPNDRAEKDEYYQSDILSKEQADEEIKKYESEKAREKMLSIIIICIVLVGLILSLILRRRSGRR